MGPRAALAARMRRQGVRWWHHHLLPSCTRWLSASAPNPGDVLLRVEDKETEKNKLGFWGSRLVLDFVLRKRSSAVRFDPTARGACGLGWAGGGEAAHRGFPGPGLG